MPSAGPSATSRPEPEPTPPRPPSPLGAAGLWTIGYAQATPATLVAALGAAGVELVVDVRAVPASRRPGFAKGSLSATLEAAGIGYRHLKALGTPAAGREAARSGRVAEMHEIFRTHLAGLEAQAALAELEELVRRGRRVCLLCLEADPAHCHRSLVADALAARLDLEVRHLQPAPPAELTP